MLADTPFPRGYDASLAGMGTLSEGFERSVASPLYLVGYAQWDARFDLFLLCQTIISSSFTGRSQTRLLTQLQGLAKQPRQCLQMPFAKFRQRTMVGMFVDRQVSKRYILVGLGLDLARTVAPCAVAVQ